MNVKLRAIHTEDKEKRRHAILDATERLLLAHSQRVASVDEVAAEAGLAKGTVYLYFPSKEELLLALHERQTQTYFTALLDMLARKKQVTVDDMLAVVRLYIVQPPCFLPLASLCFGLMEKSVPIEAAGAFKARTVQWLERSSRSLERHFPSLAKGQGVTFLIHSYALIVGLWQILHPSPVRDAILQRPDLAMIDRDYATEVEVALRALWQGHLGSPVDIPVPRPKAIVKRVKRTIRKKS